MKTKRLETHMRSDSEFHVDHLQATYTVCKIKSKHFIEVGSPCGATSECVYNISERCERYGYKFCKMCLFLCLHLETSSILLFKRFGDLSLII